jgi:hypothetical protein
VCGPSNSLANSGGCQLQLLLLLQGPPIPDILEHRLSDVSKCRTSLLLGEDGAVEVTYEDGEDVFRVNAEILNPRSPPPLSFLTSTSTRRPG